MDSRTDTVDWHARKTHSIPTRPKPASTTNFLKAREEDQSRTKGLLAAGKRVADGERSEVEQFQGLKRGAGTAKALKSMQKGVKKATEGMQ